MLVEQGLQTLANTVVNSRADLIFLLELHNWEIPPGISAEKLTGVVLEALERDREGRFERDLIRLSSSTSNFMENMPALNVGSDPVSAIAGGIGSLADLTRTIVDRKQLKKQANAATMNSILGSQGQQVVPVQPPAPYPPAAKPVWPWVLGGLLLLGLGGLGLYLKSQST